MAFNQFTNLDFNGIRDQIKDYLRTNTDFSDFDFDGSNFSILISKKINHLKKKLIFSLRELVSFITRKNLLKVLNILN